MAGLVVVSGACGKGAATYEMESLRLPDGSSRPIETVRDIEVHGDIAGRGRDSWALDVLRGVKGGLSLASNLEITGTAGLAASALGAGLASLDGQDGETKRALIELTFLDGTTLVALGHPALAGLMMHDRDLVCRTIERTRDRSSELPLRTGPAGDPGPATLAGVADLAGAVTEKAGAALTSALSLFKRERT